MEYTVEVCKNCRRLFKYYGFGSRYCPECAKIDEEQRDKVRAFIREHGPENKYEISLATGVPESEIAQYLRDGMLEIPEGSAAYIKCESCGRDIRSGRWCPECAARMSKGQAVLVATGETPKTAGQGKMRFFGKERKPNNHK